jgi:hypothetical protein
MLFSEVRDGQVFSLMDDAAPGHMGLHQFVKCGDKGVVVGARSCATPPRSAGVYQYEIRNFRPNDEVRVTQ